MEIKNIAFIYALILVAINILAVGFTSSLVTHISVNSGLLDIMNEYLVNNTFINIFFQTIPFAVPFILCFVYTTKLINQNNDKQVKKLLVNMPFAYSLIGISGWIIGFLINFIFTFYELLAIPFAIQHGNITNSTKFTT